MMESRGCVRVTLSGSPCERRAIAVRRPAFPGSDRSPMKAPPRCAATPHLGVALLLQCVVGLCLSCNSGSPSGKPPAVALPEQTALERLQARYSAFHDVAHVSVPTGRLGRVLVASPDGKTLFVGGEDGTLYGMPLAGGLPRLLVGHTRAVWDARITNDGQTLISAGHDHTLRVWRTRDGREERSIDAHKKTIKALALSTDGTLAATGGRDHIAKVWRLADGHLLHTLAGHSDTVYDVTFTSDGQRLVTAGRDATLRRWSLATGRPDGGPLSFPNSNVALGWTTDRKTLLMTGRHGRLVWVDPTAWRVLAEHTVDRNAGSALAVSAAGEVAVGFADGRIAVYSEDPRIKAPLVAPFVAHSRHVSGLAFADGDLFSLAEDGTLMRWHLGMGPPEAAPIPPVPSGLVTALSLHPDGARFVAASRGLLFLGSAPGTPRGLDLGPGGVSSVRWLPDGTAFLVGRETGDILRVAPDGAPGGVAKFGGGAVRHLAVSSDSRTLYAAGDHVQVVAIDLATLAITRTYRDHASRVVALALDPTGRRLASAEEEHRTVIRKLTDEAPELVLRGHRITHLAFSPDGKLLASVQDRRLIRLHLVEVQQKGPELRGHTHGITGLAFHPGGDVLITVDNQGSVRAWSVPDGVFLASGDAGRRAPRALDLVAPQSGDLRVMTGGEDPRGSIRLLSLGAKP